MARTSPTGWRHDPQRFMTANDFRLWSASGRGGVNTLSAINGHPSRDPERLLKADLRHSASGSEWLRKRLAVIEPKPVCPIGLNWETAVSRCPVRGPSLHSARRSIRAIFGWLPRMPVSCQKRTGASSPRAWEGHQSREAISRVSLGEGFACSSCSTWLNWCRWRSKNSDGPISVATLENPFNIDLSVIRR